MIPENHLLRVIEKHFDWNFVYEEVEKLYSKLGRKSIDPEVLIKIKVGFDIIRGFSPVLFQLFRSVLYLEIFMLFETIIV